MDDTYWDKKRPLELRVRVAGAKDFEDGISEKEAQRWGRLSADFGLLVRAMRHEDHVQLSVALLEPSGDVSRMTTEQLFNMWISITGFIARRPPVGEDQVGAQSSINCLRSFLGMLGYTPELQPIASTLPDASAPATTESPSPQEGEAVVSTDSDSPPPPN